MVLPRSVVGIVSIAIQVVGAGVVFGQDYPNKPIRIVASEIGTSGDFVARIIVQAISDPLGQRVIVDNRGGFIGGVTVAKAAPDGYTLLLAGNTFLMGPLLQKMPYDPVKDFSPITLAAISPNVLVVHPSLPVRSVKELIALAKVRPGELNYASNQTGSSTHLSAELFKSMAGVNMARVAYKNGATQLADLVGGQVQLTFGNTAAVNPNVKSGRLRALAVTSSERSALLPELPTIAASGLPGYEAVQMSGIFAPVKTPESVINRLNQEIVRFLKTPEGKERLLSSGVEAVGNSAEQFSVKIKSEIARMDQVIKNAGISAD